LTLEGSQHRMSANPPGSIPSYVPFWTGDIASLNPRLMATTPAGVL